MHRDRVRNVRSQVDTALPVVAHMEHVRNNLKKEQMLEDRYSEIDRENRILLKKMSEIMRHEVVETPREKRQPGPQSLNRDARKKELLRITKENQSILKRIQQAQPVYNHIEWEGSSRKNVNYLKNIAEYPLVLRSARGANRSSELVALDLDGRPKEEMLTARSEKSGVKGGADYGDEGARYVLKEGLRIGDTYYLVEMSTDGRALNISAYDGDTQTLLELVVQEKVHRRVYRETNGDYAAIARHLRVDGRGRLVLDDDFGSSQSRSQSPPRKAGEAWGDRQTPEELDAEAMVVYKTKTGSAGSVNAEIDLNSTGDAQVRLRGLTPSSGAGTNPHNTAR